MHKEGSIEIPTIDLHDPGCLTQYAEALGYEGPQGTLEFFVDSFDDRPTLLQNAKSDEVDGLYNQLPKVVRLQVVDMLGSLSSLGIGPLAENVRRENKYAGKAPEYNSPTAGSCVLIRIGGKTGDLTVEEGIRPGSKLIDLGSPIVGAGIHIQTEAQQLFQSPESDTSIIAALKTSAPQYQEGKYEQQAKALVLAINSIRKNIPEVTPQQLQNIAIDLADYTIKQALLQLKEQGLIAIQKMALSFKTEMGETFLVEPTKNRGILLTKPDGEEIEIDNETLKGDGYAGHGVKYTL